MINMYISDALSALSVVISADILHSHTCAVSSKTHWVTSKYTFKSCSLRVFLRSTSCWHCADLSVLQAHYTIPAHMPVIHVLVILADWYTPIGYLQSKQFRLCYWNTSQALPPLCVAAPVCWSREPQSVCSIRHYTCTASYALASPLTLCLEPRGAWVCTCLCIYACMYAWNVQICFSMSM